MSIAKAFADNCSSSCLALYFHIHKYVHCNNKKVY